MEDAGGTLPIAVHSQTTAHRLFGDRPASGSSQTAFPDFQDSSVSCTGPWARGKQPLGPTSVFGVLLIPGEHLDVRAGRWSCCLHRGLLRQGGSYSRDGNKDADSLRLEMRASSLSAGAEGRAGSGHRTPFPFLFRLPRLSVHLTSILLCVIQHHQLR